MRSRPKHLRVITATLLLLLTSSLQLPGIVGISSVLAQESANQDRKVEAERLYQEGIQQFNRGQLQESLETFQEVLAITREIGSLAGEAATLNSLGRIYARLGDFTKALEFYQQALAIYREIGNLRGEGVTLNDIGEAYQYQGQDSQALEIFQQALDIIRKGLGSEHPLNALILTNLGEIYQSQGRASEAIHLFERALAVGRGFLGSAGNLEIRGLRNLGNIYTELGNYKKAIENLQRSLAIARNLGNRQAERQALEDLGKAYAALGDYIGAIEYFNQSLALAQEIGDRQGALSILSSLASSLAALNPQEALDRYQQALAIAQEIGNESEQGFTLHGIGLTYQRLGEYSKALEFYKQALKIYKRIGDQVGEGDTFNNIGAIYAKQGQYSKSLGFYQKALTIFRSIDNFSGTAAALNNSGLLHYELGQYERALEIYQEVLNIRRNIGDRAGEATTLNNNGLVYDVLKQNAKALEFYQQALTIHQETGNLAGEAITLNNIGLQYDALGQSSEAIKSLKEALSIFRELEDRANIANTLDSIGTVYKNSEKYPQALEHYQQALAILEEFDNRPLARLILSNIGSLYEKQQQTELAIVFYKQSVNLTETIREDLRTLPRAKQESYTETVADTYRSLANLLLSQGRILEAQQVLELLKVQEVRDFTRNANAGGDTEGIAYNPTEEQILKEHGTLIAFGQKVEDCQKNRCEQLSQLLDQRDILTEQFNQTVRQLEAEIRTRLAQDDGFLDPRNLSGDVREIVNAQPGTILIYPFVQDNKIWLLWTTKGGIVKSVEVPDVGRQKLGETVLKFRQLLQSPNSDIATLQETSKQLYDWLLKPLETELKANDIKNLVFSLDRVTRYIPMSALFDGENYLVENYTISTILSADLTDTSDNSLSGNPDAPVLALGLSDAVGGFNPLPNVPEELDAIVRKDDTDTQGVYPGLEFLNEAFDYRALRDNLYGRKILHIATHGEFVPGRSHESYLLLGTGEKLAIPEIEKLQDLGNVQLVVLSACETALGEPGQDGTEINGISFYFLNQGVKAVAASLWLVNDASTSQLMQQFYHHLAQNTTKAEALRQAQLSLLRGDSAATENTSDRAIAIVQSRPGSQTPPRPTAPGFSHPYYWAPFILIGNGL